ncbi:MAG: UvrD-helicase domain-containing protein, partial [Dehalococcoidia bacterium]|nr:UvrD-helicase domain-containing protein [Dehalococcoidia bacterium]
MNAARPTVAISADFLTAFSQVPRGQQKKVREFAERFRRDPTAASINYEPLHLSRDDKVRSVRIGSDYRAIVIHPEAGNVYLLVWIDHHDEAMKWAANKSFDVNAYTGSLQIVDHSIVAPTPPEVLPVSAPGPSEVLPAPGSSPSDELLSAFSDDDLLSLGAPQALLPSIRAVRTDSDLDAIAAYLPEEVSEALYMLAMGFNLAEVRAELQKRPLVAPGTEPDFVAALDHPDSRRRFAVVQHEADLSEMLAAPLDRWRIFLHPSQETLVTKHFNGPARVLGGAGTGKTVVAMHRARFLVEHVFTDDSDRVLFVTFTKNLARNIEANLRALCGDSREFERIEVTHLHRWLVRLLKSQGLPAKIARPEDISECWQEALAAVDAGGLNETWLRAEWEQVVQAQGLESRDEY